MPRPWTRSKKLRRACGGNPREARTRHTGRSGSKTRCGWVRRTSSPIAGPRRVHAPVLPTIKNPSESTCSVRSAPNTEPAPPSSCRPGTPRLCSFTTVRSQPKSLRGAHATSHQHQRCSCRHSPRGWLRYADPLRRPATANLKLTFTWTTPRGLITSNQPLTTDM
jgi:hypothetical protein